jgi:hypothetical protein
MLESFVNQKHNRRAVVTQAQKDQKLQEQKSAQELNSFTELVLSLSLQCDGAKRDNDKSIRKQTRA